MNFRLDGKKVLVVGAGRGLGRAIADGLAEQGAVVYGTSRDQATSREIAERYGTAPLSVDLSDADSIRAFVADLLELTGGIDLLVNNAGLNIPKPAVEVTEQDWNAVLGTNLTGPFFMTTALAKAWLEAGTTGSVVNVASQAGIVAIEDRAAYGASKAALIHLTKVLALEWASKGIRINAVAPTFIRTELTESTLNDPQRAAELLGRIPVGRFGQPEDVVGAVLYLLGETSALVTGHTLTIDGGYTIR
ncbi:2-deoxy-D-gluconate 3-dehydrogenase [Arthrobacter subterraneus]|uniref:2-deoxy-D-gluconate 3-dehydrogenase n=1 Tax=Arthrobacter subterraneus TaxID=335973 RepID=A0A1G8CAL6_9MICC|nr:glucose 1-dehydrogenase [Arthrobacter subterraneus]SDH42415.1 2-deoxy-D-gluconate 3-dehydrogenase [Arthrobacter subterraneus]